MAQLSSRINLGAANIPFLSEFAGRGIILPQYDQNYRRDVLSQADSDKDIGIPQIIYCHNVIPTGQGMQSVSFFEVCRKAADVGSNFDQCFVLRDGADNKVYFSPARGKNYVFDPITDAWRSLNPITGLVTGNPLVTHAYINGTTYIYYEHIGCYRYDAVLDAIVSVTLAGLVPSAINGITAAGGYLVAWDDTTLYWSSLTDPTDFVPSLATGAGSNAIQEARGKLLFSIPIFGGLVVYTVANAVIALLTGNVRFPFQFREISGSSGVAGQHKVSGDANLAEQYIVSSSGVQKLDRATCVGVFPDAGDFLSAKLYEDLDTNTNVLVTLPLSAQLKSAITVVGSRWLVISYGRTSFYSYSHAIVYDLVHKRWGKIRLDHVDCFDAIPLSPDAVGFKDQFAFLQEDGCIYRVDFALTKESVDSAVIIGKFQFNRARWLTLQGFEIENVARTGDFDAYALPTYDGKNFQPATAMLCKESSLNFKHFLTCTSGLNVSILCKGTFNLTCGVVSYTKHGSI